MNIASIILLASVVISGCGSSTFSQSPATVPTSTISTDSSNGAGTVQPGQSVDVTVRNSLTGQWASSCTPVYSEASPTVATMWVVTKITLSITSDYEYGLYAYADATCSAPSLLKYTKRIGTYQLGESTYGIKDAVGIGTHGLSSTQAVFNKGRVVSTKVSAAADEHLVAKFDVNGTRFGWVGTATEGAVYMPDMKRYDE